MDTQDKNQAGTEKVSEGKTENQAGGGLFRKAAMSRMAAGQHVDELLRVSKPSDWFFAGTLAALVVVTIAWSFLGRIPVMASGTGLIQPETGIARVVSSVSGIILSEMPAEGACLKKGDLVVKISTEDDMQRLRNTIEQERLAKEDYEKQKWIYSVTSEMSKKTVAKVTKLMENNIKELELLYKTTQEDYTEMKELYEKGYSTKADILAAEQAMTNASQSLHNAEIQLAKERVSAKSDLIQKKQILRRAEGDYLQVQMSRKEIESSLKSGEIRAPITGLISESTAEYGDFVPANRPLCLVLGEGPPVLIHLFFSSNDAKRTEVGNEVKIEVETFPSDMYGKLIGRVTDIELLPANTPLIEKSCGYSETLTKELLSGPPVNRVTVMLLTERKGGKLIYKKAGTGKPFTISTGMVCTGSIILENEVPITLVIPALKRWFGVRS